MIEEKFQDIIVKYIYIKKHVWFHPAMREEFQNHPLQGRVYRDIYNPKTGNHKVPVSGSDGIGFETLVGSNEASDYELVEINLDNILDFDIREEDLDLLNKWIESENSDIRQMYSPTAPLNKLKQALHNHNMDEADALARGTEALHNLWHINNLKYDIIVNLINYLSEADLDSYADPGNYLRHHPSHGLGVNIAQALRALDNYASDNKRVSEDLADLYVAVEALVTEIERKITTNQVD